MTGAGKTHTMQGSDRDPGLIQRSLSTILQLIEENGLQNKVNINLSYFEIYNNKVYDLLNPNGTELAVRESNKNIVISNLHHVKISNIAEFNKLYLVSNRNRRTASTSLNTKSSRSHAILRFIVETQESKNTIVVGKLQMIDLAGNEDNRKTNNSGQTMKESTSINSSLHVLGKVVNAINSNSVRIPFRDSKLTRLLQDSLGGNSYSIIIANVAPGKAHFNKTNATLTFASSARQIGNNPVVNIHKVRSSSSEQKEDELFLDKNNENQYEDETEEEFEIGTKNTKLKLLLDGLNLMPKRSEPIPIYNVHTKRIVTKITTT
eukprot:TRINITY_DN6742_c0_g1_i2.p1 TRINITY_DN6742_c0_g1~~TRINITY_DN6742_c0_g1_i2.p1  ORF type:complete len:320 (-),score=31.36 TRINITY_DN6742_c0_g1_i2:34-993(-)